MSRCLGRAPDSYPMPNLVEWQVVPAGWVQVFVDDQRAGATVVNLAVDDLDAETDELKQRGLEPGESSTPTRACGCQGLTIPMGTRFG
jgi:glyoxylase I family protein